MSGSEAELIPIEKVKKTRKLGYAATKPTAPAYSWGKARERVKNDPGPGPGEYDTSVKWRKGTGFGSATRGQKQFEDTPSPIDYTPSTANLKSSPGYSFRTKSVPEHLKSTTPGPGQYQPDSGHDLVKPGTPAFSLVAKARAANEGTATPSPQEYNADFRAKEVHGATLKFRHSSSNVDPGPSPLDYSDFNFRRPASEGKSFGTSRNRMRDDTDSPGPAVYYADVGAVKQRNQAWTMPRSERDPPDNRGVPGPGTYLHGPVIDRDCGHGVRSDMRSAPAYSVAGKPSSYPPAESPGPTDYGLPNDPRLKSAPTYTFHGVNALRSEGERAPGPGTYDWIHSASTVRASAPAFSLGLKHEDPRLRASTPGPNEYNPTMSGRQGVTLKFRHDMTGKDPTPGPHEYADGPGVHDIRKIYCSGYNRKGFSFGVKPRPKLLDQTPGPIYQVGCTTLGIAAATRLADREMNRIAVL